MSRPRPIGIVIIVVAVVLLAFLHLIDSGDDTAASPVKFVIFTLLTIAVGLALYGWLIPRAEHRDAEGPDVAQVGLACSAFGLVCIPLLFLGLPFVLAPTGIVLGHIGRRQIAAENKRVEEEEQDDEDDREEAKRKRAEDEPIDSGEESRAAQARQGFGSQSNTAFWLGIVAYVLALVFAGYGEFS